MITTVKIRCMKVEIYAIASEDHVPRSIRMKAILVVIKVMIMAAAMTVTYDI
jgi:hypothetical protein